MSTIEILNRASGIILWGPSIQSNIAILNCIWSVRLLNSSFLFRLLVFSTFLSIVADMLMVTCLLGWFVDSTWPSFTRLVVAMCFIKRIYSIASVSILFRRFEAVVLVKYRSPYIHYFLPIYVSGYTLLSLTTAFFHLFSYSTNNWNSAQTRDSNIFKVYRILNLIVGSYYFIIGIWSDIMFLLLKRKSRLIAERIFKVRNYYNIHLYLLLELLLYLTFILTTIWSMYNSDVSSPPYIEQCLLTFSTLNAFYSVYSSSDTTPHASTATESKTNFTNQKNQGQPEIVNRMSLDAPQL